MTMGDVGRVSRPTERRFEVDVGVGVDDGLDRLEALAEVWGASWRRDGRGGHLALPVRAGVRRGLVEGPVTVEPNAGGARVSFEIADRFYRVQYSAFFLLLIGAIAGIVATITPFAPSLLPLLPICVILAVASWLLIVSRLHNSGPEEFLAQLAAADAPDESAGSAESP